MLQWLKGLQAYQLNELKVGLLDYFFEYQCAHNTRKWKFIMAVQLHRKHNSVFRIGIRNSMWWLLCTLTTSILERLYNTSLHSNEINQTLPCCKPTKRMHSPTGKSYDALFNQMSNILAWWGRQKHGKDVITACCLDISSRQATSVASTEVLI